MEGISVKLQEGAESRRCGRKRGLGANKEANKQAAPSKRGNLRREQRTRASQTVMGLWSLGGRDRKQQWMLLLRKAQRQ